MKTYTVRIEIQVEATSPQEAVLQAETILDSRRVIFAGVAATGIILAYAGPSYDPEAEEGSRQDCLSEWGH